MDKRTLLFVVLLALCLFGVNFFFEQQRAESMRYWNEQQEAKKIDKLDKLEKQIAARIASPSALPLATFYADSALQQPLTTAVQGGNAYLALAWSKTLPNQVYIHDPKSDKSIALTLANAPEGLNSPVAYRASYQDKLQISPLQELGKYDLQLVMISKDMPSEAKILLAEYADGRVTIPVETIQNLRTELGKIPQALQLSDAIALVRKKNAKEGEYLPAAIYKSSTRQVERLDAIPSLEALIAQRKEHTPTSQSTEEKFYVLVTPWQQLVFSNKGGALAEINLPFPSQENKESVVKEIEFDRQMAENHPYNAHFPAHPYYTPGEKDSKEFVKHEKGTLGGYYPFFDAI